MGKLFRHCGSLRVMVLLGLPAGLCSCQPRGTPAVPQPTVATTAPAPVAVTPDDPVALEQLASLQEQGAQADKSSQFIALERTADALAALPLRQPRNSSQRDDLVRQFRARAEVIRQAVHRFLFVQLEPLPSQQRQKLLDQADRSFSSMTPYARALGEQEFAAGRRYLKATPSLKPGTKLDGLLVRPGGDVSNPWQKEFNEAFNARVRELLEREKAASTRPAGASQNP